jgi:hypothetical protein
MTNESLGKIKETTGEQCVEPNAPAFPTEDLRDGSEAKSRRDALAILAKHTAYTAPAVVAMLTLSAKRAAAFSF